MKTKISRISRRTVSIVLTMLMMVSVLGFGSLITASALSINLAGTFNNWNANDSNYSASSSPASWDIEFANTNEVQFKVVIDGNWSGITSNNDGYYGGTLGVDKQIYKNAGGNIHWTPPSAGTYTFTVSGSGDSYSLCITEASSGGGGGGDGAVTDADLLAVLNGTKVMFYGGELTSWNQSTMYINTTNSASNVTASASMTGSYNLHSQGASRFALFTATSQRYYMAHSGWAANLRTRAAVQAGEAYIVRGSTSNANFTQQAKSGSDYLYKISNSATTTASTTIDSSITQGSNLSVSTSGSAGNSVLGIANSFEYYLYDGSSYYKVTPSSGEIDTSELAVGSGYKVITVLKDTNGLRVKADEDSFSVTSATTCTLTLSETSKQTLNIGETFDLTVSSEHCTGSASNLSISSSASTYVSATLKSTGSNSRTYTIKALKPTSSDVTLTAACSADSDENQPTLKVAVNTPALSFSYDPSTILTGGNTTSPSAVTATNMHTGYTVGTVSYSRTSGSAATVNSSTGVVTSSASTTGNVTVTATATVTYNSVSYSATGTATVKVEAPASIYFKQSQTGGNSAVGQGGDLMTYDNTSGLYKITKNYTSGNWYYIVIYDSSESNNLSYKNGTLNETLRSGSGYTIYTGNDNTENPLHVAAPITGTYNFYFNATTNKIYVEFPHTVTFDANGHGTAPSAQVVTYGGKATTPTAPTAAGYTFGGWFKEAGCTNAWDFSTDTVTADTILYAKWTTNSHTLTVNAKYKSSSSGDYTNAADFSNEITMAGSAASQSKSLNYNATCALVAPDKSSSGYDFIGWYDGDTRKSTNRSYTYTMPDENKTLTARYNKQYTLTLSSAHGTIKDSAGTNTISKIDVFYDDTTPANFKVQVSNGWKINNAGSNATTINKYFTQPANGSTGTVTFTGATVATANKVDATITVDFTQITMPVDIGAYKTDDINSTNFTPWDQAAPTISPALTNGTTPWSSSNSTVTKNGTTPAGYEFVGWYYSNTATFDPATISRTYTVSGTGNTKTFAPNGTEGTNRYSVYALYKKTKYSVIGNIDGEDFANDYDMTFNSGAGTYSYTFNNLPAATSYNFKIRKNHSYSDGGNWGNKSFTSSNKTDTLTNNTATNATIATQYSGDYTFTFNPSTGSLTVTYPTRNVTKNVLEISSPAQTAPAVSYITTFTDNNNDTWSITAKEDDSYNFKGWTWTVGGVNEAAGVTIANASSKSTTATVTTTSAVVIIAKFSKTADRSLTIAAAGTDNGSSFSVNLPETGFTYKIGSGSTTSYSTTVSGIANGSQVVATAPETIISNGDTYKFVEWEGGPTTLTNTITRITADTTLTPKYRRVYYITAYTSWVDNGDDFDFVAAPPRKIVVGNGDLSDSNNVRATYTYAAGSLEYRGEDNTYYRTTTEGSGAAAAEHIVSATGNYYEGNKLVVLAGEKVKLFFTSLASSDAIRGVYFNNDLRYTVEGEPDNYFKQRAAYTGSSESYWGSEGDDEWKYDYAVNTTLFADDSYYTGAAASTIAANKSSYIAKDGVDQNTHTVEWIATGNYYNIDIELGNKYKIYINNDETDGLKIENNNEEGYYYGGESMKDNFKISIDTSANVECTYAFNSTTATVKDKDGNTVSGVTVSPKQSNGSAATNLSNLSYFLVDGEMPAKDVYITIPFAKNYNMKLANIVVSDQSTNKRTMITECGSNSTSATDCVGTITAVPKKGNSTLSDISTDGTYYTYPGNNNFNTVNVYTTNSNNKYLKGGVNKSGSNVEDGYSVTYTYTASNNAYGPNYSFVGWFEGSQSGDGFTVDYNKKLSGNISFTYKPSKNTTVIAVATRDMYIGGNFTNSGAYTSTSASQTWASNRIKMEYDPTYVNPSNSSEKGRYFYTFDSVTANTEYQFRCYDTVSGTATTNLTVWNAHIDDIHGYNNGSNTDIADYRSKYDVDGTWTTHGGFMFTNATGKSFSEIKVDGTEMNSSERAISQNHQANGYGNPVTVYFYAYDSGISVDSTYQWSMAYVSEGRGIDVLDPSKDDEAAGKYNTPTASVANKTVNNQDVVVTAQPTKYGNGNNNGKYEKIYECQVKEKDGQIQITATPDDANVELQAFLVYNIETKESEAVLGPFTEAAASKGKSYTGNVTIPQNSKIYVVPIYKFTDEYIEAQGLGNHKVYVRTSDIDKDDWGGLVAMYSWGTTSGYNSGGWPGQLLIPSDDGNSFYGYLTYTKGGLAGVTINNYSPIWGNGARNFIGTYEDKGVSDVSYSGNSTKVYQSYDYREPISIVDNISEDIYGDEDLDLTFALKKGNKTGATAPSGTNNNSDSVDGTSAFNANYNWEYLTDRSGKTRVDLNGNKIGNVTATYYIVCNFTDDYSRNKPKKEYPFHDGGRDGRTAHNQFSIDWNVYNSSGQSVKSGILSASYTDIIKSDMVTYISDQLLSDDYPVNGKAVKIAYELPGTWNEAVRYSGQWYSDGVNNLIETNALVGVYSEGVFTPSDTNDPGYAKATINLSKISPTAEGETVKNNGGTAVVTKTHASDGKVTFKVSTTENFKGWYREDGKGGYEPVGTNYLNQEITPSFNDDITFYAFYSASASYQFKYTGRDGSNKSFSAKGTELTAAELSNGGILDTTVRQEEIASQLAKITDIKVFNHTLTYSLSSPDNSKPYTISFNAGDEEDTYKVDVYDGSGDKIGTTTAKSFGNGAVDLFRDPLYSNSIVSKLAYANPVPATSGSDVFIGWKKYVDGTATGDYLSTQLNYGYAATEDMSIIACYGSSSDKADATTDTWKAYVDKSVVTQELTSADEGTIYHDNVIAFRNGIGTNTTLDISSGSSNECGLVIFAQEGDTPTATQKTTFTGIADSSLENSVQYFVTGAGAGKTAAKLSSSKYGNAYALKVKADDLSDLNRIDLCQILDYKQFSSGNYKVMAYYYNGSTFKYSSVESGTYTVS